MEKYSILIKSAKYEFNFKVIRINHNIVSAFGKWKFQIITIINKFER